MPSPSVEDLQVNRLGEPGYQSPLADRYRCVDETDRVLVSPRALEVQELQSRGQALPSFEPAGARARNFFAAGPETRCGVITCGGLCPGLNDVIRAVVLCAWHQYGIREIYGFRYGYAGLRKEPPAEPVRLDPGMVGRIHELGGTVLGTSRGPQDLDEMADTLESLQLDILLAIGGDGTLRGASALAERLRDRGSACAVVGVPKTIDNDIHYVARSFGFSTAVEEATRAIASAHAEASGAYHGVGLVKLMGRESGFIAATATLANPDVNFCLVPEFPLALDGPDGFLAALERRLAERKHAVVVVAEGFGQELLQSEGAPDRDLSGNKKLQDVGTYLKQRIEEHFATRGLPLALKYIDPSYTIRACPAGALDSELCLRLGHNAVHAAMAGRTDVMIGFWNSAMVHVPIPVATGSRRQLHADDPTWIRVLEATGQTPLYAHSH